LGFHLAITVSQENSYIIKIAIIAKHRTNNIYDKTLCAKEEAKILSERIPHFSGKFSFQNKRRLQEEYQEQNK